MDKPLTMIEDLLDDYLFLYGTNEGQQRLEADMIAFLRGAIAAPDRPFPTADEMYIALKTKSVTPPTLIGLPVVEDDAWFGVSPLRLAGSIIFGKPLI